MKNTEEILTQLSLLLTSNVIGDKQYESRYKGFVGELDFQITFPAKHPTYEIFSGGYLIPTEEGAKAIDHPIYVTISKDDCLTKDYISIYRNISELPCKALFYIQWDSQIPFDKWLKKDIMGDGNNLSTPCFKVYKYDSQTSSFINSEIEEFLSHYVKVANRKKNTYAIEESTEKFYFDKLKIYPEVNILDMYVERLIFDGFLGFGVKKGIPSDIDYIYRNNQDKFVFVEVKEKDLSKKPPVGFGMDIDRYKSIKFIQDQTKTPYIYVVKKVNNQEERILEGWYYISIDNFINNLGNNTIQGGTGMRSIYSNNPTKICPFDKFKQIMK